MKLIPFVEVLIVGVVVLLCIIGIQFWFLLRQDSRPQSEPQPKPTPSRIKAGPWIGGYQIIEVDGVEYISNGHGICPLKK